MERIHPTVVFITHDIDEAILLGDQLVVVSNRPRRVTLTSSVPPARPRDWEMTLQATSLDLKRQAMGILAI